MELGCVSEKITNILDLNFVGYSLILLADLSDSASTFCKIGI